MMGQLVYLAAQEHSHDVERQAAQHTHEERQTKPPFGRLVRRFTGRP
jgi:hypothetical protein